MKILYVASEAGPFAASGGLGDVMGALPKTVKDSHPDYTVEVALPLYSTMSAVYKDKLVYHSDISFKLSWRNTGARIYTYTECGVTYYFFENHYYFDRGRLYGEYDDAERFAFFSLAVVEFIKQSEEAPDILHANDWQTSLTIVYLKTEYAHISSLANVKTLYTIHNIEYQGKFDPYILGDVFGINRRYYKLLEFDGCINLMKAAIVCTDYITTVSPNYAHELEYDFFAFGLSEVIKNNSYKLKGVINGIDYGYFSPDKGADIDFPYTKRTVKSGKAKNKAALLAELGMDTSDDIPLIVMITRLASQKGIELFLHIANEILSKRVQMIILGTGEAKYENELIELENKYSNFKALIKFDRVISKRLYASADIFLMPSKSEPCGLAQMISCSYGTVPIVRSVGGLYDTIIPYGEENSNGFRFDNFNAHELLSTIERALDVYKNEKKWSELRRRTINSSFTWSKSAEDYVSIYKNILK